jgi:hypothetical protein
VQQKHILETNTHTHNAASIARDKYLRTLKAELDYTVSRIKIGNKRTSSQYKATNIIYAKLYKSAIFINIFYSMDHGTLRKNKDLENKESVGQFH